MGNQSQAPKSEHGRVTSSNKTELSLKFHSRMLRMFPLWVRTSLVSRKHWVAMQPCSNGELIEIKKNKWRLSFNLKIKTKNGFVPGVRMIPWELVHTETTVTEGNNNKKHYQVVHSMLGHMGEDATRATATKLGIGITRGTSTTCISCSVSKAKQKNLNRTIDHMAKEPGDIFFVWH